MHNLRVSVTDIDSYLYWKSSEQSIEELMSRLRKEGPETEAMRAGTAFHKALELAEEGELLFLEADGYRFFLPLAEDLDIQLPTIRELKVEREFQVDSNLIVTLVGKVDALYGDIVYDHKTTGKLDLDRFMDSYQWRMYLRQLNANTFQYNIFETSEIDERCYNIVGYHEFKQYRYPDLDQDCRLMLAEFLDFLGVARLRFPTSDCRLADLLKSNLEVAA